MASTKGIYSTGTKKLKYIYKKKKIKRILGIIDFIIGLRIFAIKASLPLHLYISFIY